MRAVKAQHLNRTLVGVQHLRDVVEKIVRVERHHDGDCARRLHLRVSDGHKGVGVAWRGQICADRLTSGEVTPGPGGANAQQILPSIGGRQVVVRRHDHPHVGWVGTGDDAALSVQQRDGAQKRGVLQRGGEAARHGGQVQRGVVGGQRLSCGQFGDAQALGQKIFGVAGVQGGLVQSVAQGIALQTPQCVAGDRQHTDDKQRERAKKQQPEVPGRRCHGARRGVSLCCQAAAARRPSRLMSLTKRSRRACQASSPGFKA